jgi:hypothetical protein
MDTVKQRLAVAANNHRWPAAAASEFVTSGHITRINDVSDFLKLDWTAEFLVGADGS